MSESEKELEILDRIRRQAEANEEAKGAAATGARNRGFSQELLVR
jgi:hypothetical protein